MTCSPPIDDDESDDDDETSRISGNDLLLLKHHPQDVVVLENDDSHDAMMQEQEQHEQDHEQQHRPLSQLQRSSITNKSHHNKAKLKKAPNAPKRFKSAFILFSAELHKQIRAEMGDKATTERTASISKTVSNAWKNLSPQEREKWEWLARRDRARYEVEKSLYQGPWQVPNIRKQKDACAPKRPVSAFLAFANSRRAQVKRQMPAAASNGDISRALAAMWKDATEEEKQPYVDDETERRQEYMTAVTDFRKRKAEGKRLEQHQREAMALCIAERLHVISNISNSHVQPRHHHHNEHVVAAAAADGHPGNNQHQHHCHQYEFFHPEILMAVDDNAPRYGSCTNSSSYLISSQQHDVDGASSNISHHHYYTPAPNHCATITSLSEEHDNDDKKQKDDEELMHSFFYPEYLRDAIQRCSIIENETAPQKQILKSQLKPGENKKL